MTVRGTLALALALALVPVPAGAAPRPEPQDVSAPVRVRSQHGPTLRAKVAVAPVVFTAAEIAAEDIAAEVRAGVEQSGVELVELDSPGVTHIIEPTLTAEDKVYELHIVARDTRVDRVVAEVRETCEVCGVAEVVELAHRQSAALGERIAKLAPMPGRIDVSSAPSGATIAVDDTNVGRTPVALELDAGPHRLRATLAGHSPQLHDVVTVGGVAESWSFALQPLPTAGRAKRMRSAGWAMLGIGSAAVVPGIVFLALDERPYRARCSGADVDGDGDCRKIYDGVTYGAVLTAVGLALVATGIGLVVAARRNRAARGRAR